LICGFWLRILLIECVIVFIVVGELVVMLRMWLFVLGVLVVCMVVLMMLLI